MKIDHLERIWDDDIDDWEEDARLYKGEYFTGIAYLTHENGQLKTEGVYIEGLPEGLHRDWYENGQLENEVLFTIRRGSMYSKSWYKNGQKKSHSFTFHGWVKEEKVWDEYGVLQTHDIFQFDSDTVGDILRRRKDYEEDCRKLYEKYDLGEPPSLAPIDIEYLKSKVSR